MVIWQWLRRPRLDRVGPATVHLGQAGAYSTSYAARWMDETTEPLSTVGYLTLGQARLYTLNEGWRRP